MCPRPPPARAGVYVIWRVAKASLTPRTSSIPNSPILLPKIYKYHIFEIEKSAVFPDGSVRSTKLRFQKPTNLGGSSVDRTLRVWCFYLHPFSPSTTTAAATGRTHTQPSGRGRSSSEVTRALRHRKYDIESANLASFCLF